MQQAVYFGSPLIRIIARFADRCMGTDSGLAAVRHAFTPSARLDAGSALPDKSPVAGDASAGRLLLKDGLVVRAEALT